MTYHHYDAVMRTCPGMRRPDDELPCKMQVLDSESEFFIAIYHPAFLTQPAKDSKCWKSVELLIPAKGEGHYSTYSVRTHFAMTEEQFTERIDELICPF